MSTIESWLQQAVQQQQNGNLAAAEKIYQSILSLNPTHAVALHQIGIIEFEQSHYDRALSFTEESLRLAPNQPQWWWDYANILKAVGDLASANRSYEKAILLNGNMLKDAGRIQEAIFNYQKILEMNPDNDTARRSLADLQSTGQGKLISGLDELVQHLFRKGYDHDAMLVRAAFNELSERNIPLRLGEIKVCNVKNTLRWARDNDFELIKVALEASRVPEYVEYDSFPLWKDSIQMYFQEMNNDFHVVHAKDVIVSSLGDWNRFDMLSRCNDILIEDPFWLDFIVGKGIFRAIATEPSQDTAKMLIDFTDSPLIEIADECFFIGSSTNWGHWVLDCLTILFVFGSLPERTGLKLVFGPLNDNQRACLTLLGISREHFIELRVVPGKVIRYHFNRLLFTPVSALRPAAFRYLRSHFSAAIANGGPQPELIYVSRRHEAPRHRIHNIEEVEEVFRKKGFMIIDNLKEIPTERLVLMLSKARVVVVSVGADLGNLAMCRESAVAMILVTAYCHHPSTNIEMVRRQFIPYFFGVGLLTVFVSGVPVNPHDSSIDALAHYDPKELERAIERAFERSRVG
ncbi:hypothetical protein CCP3SC1_540014 [Gammaproteobacteria bacterium]